MALCKVSEHPPNYILTYDIPNNVTVGIIINQKLLIYNYQRCKRAVPLTDYNMIAWKNYYMVKLTARN